jgi:DNA topoisomerase 2-associated protein PAT1
MAASVPFGVAQYQSVDALRPEADLDDEPVWRFLAAVAVCADPDQQQVLVTSVRDKVIEGVKGAKMGRGGPEVSAIKIVRFLPFNRLIMISCADFHLVLSIAKC